MKLWLGLLVLGCAEKPLQPCMEGTHRDGNDRCIPDDAVPSSDADADADADSDADADTDPTNDTGDIIDLDDTGTPPDLPPTPSLMNLADATITFWGGAEGARVGRAVAGAGDIDGDGSPDILVGSDRANGVGGVTYGGWVTLHLSSELPDAGLIAVESGYTRWLGESEEELLGHNLGAGGDIDGDGQMDLLIAGYHAPAGGHYRGTVYGISGTSVMPGTHSIATATWSIDGSRDVEGLGHGMSTAGDVDGDGLSDLVMGGCCSFPPERGRAWIVTGAALTSGPIDLTTHTPRWDGENDDDQAGYKTSPVGDVDGDGLDDVAIGARLESSRAMNGGKVYVLFGASMSGISIGSLADADVHLPGTSIGGEQGYDIGPVGDIDGDGLDEVVTGAYHSGRVSMVAGEAMVYFGQSMTMTPYILDTDADMRFFAYQNNHLLGVSVEGGMDFDGNGSIDLVLGASGMAPATQGDTDGDDTVGMDSPGDVYLYWGEDLGPGVHDVSDASVHFEGEELHDHAGIRVTSPGDVDADGSDDLLIGSERGQEGIGRAYLLTGLRSGDE